MAKDSIWLKIGTFAFLIGIIIVAVVVFIIFRMSKGHGEVFTGGLETLPSVP